eukprot:comp12437_c0_seq1/m.7352 comp12437_c0_seq1/g.7352  ORF comp12437_c0_seq1/g.7352 comp12437_c0_seq1/m.7352 type:complete len:374 (-) comp12437_c0_seq1:97-1218(-)
MGGGEYTTGHQRVAECYVKLSSSWMSREELMKLVSNTLAPLRISVTVLETDVEREESAQYQVIDPVTPKQVKQAQTASTPPSAYFTPTQWSEDERPGLWQAESPVPQARLFKGEAPTPKPACNDDTFDEFGAPGSIPDTADEANRQMGRQVKMTPRRLVRQSLGGQFEASPTCVVGKGLAYNLRMPTRVRTKVVTATTAGVDLAAVLGSGVGAQLQALVRGYLTRQAYTSRRATELKRTITDSLAFIGDNSCPPTSALEKQVASQLQTARADFHQLMVSGPVAERMRAIALTREYNRKYMKPQATRRRLSMGPAQKSAEADTTGRSLRSSASGGTRAPLKDMKNSQPTTTAAKAKRQVPSRQAKSSVPPAIIE